MTLGNITWSEEDHPAWTIWRKTELEHFRNTSALPHRWELFKLGWEAFKLQQGCDELNKEEENE